MRRSREERSEGGEKGDGVLLVNEICKDGDARVSDKKKRTYCGDIGHKTRGGRVML